MVGGAKIAVNGSCGITYRKEVEIFNLDSGIIRYGELKSKISSNKKIQVKCRLCERTLGALNTLCCLEETQLLLQAKVQSYQNVVNDTLNVCRK